MPADAPPRSTLLLAAVAVMLGGCAAWPFRSDTSRLSQAELRDRLIGYAADFTQTVAQTADLIVARTEDRAVRRRAVRWKIGAAQAVRDSVRMDPPTAAFVDLWTLAAQMHDFLRAAGTQREMGAGQSLAIDAARRLEARIEAIGRQVLDEQQWQEAFDAVHAFAEENPIDQLAGRVANRPSPRQPSFAKNFEFIVNLPLAPFRAVQGIDEGAQAIREFTDVADRFTTEVSMLPERSTWQLELLLYDLEERITVQESLDTLQDLSQSATSISRTAEDLPEELQVALRDVIDALAARQEQLQQTVAELRAAIGELSTAMEEGSTLAGAWQGTAQDVAEAGRAWESMAYAFGIPQAREEKKDPEEEPGFDIEEYGAAARDITTAAETVRALVADVETLSGDERIGRTAEDALASTRAEAVALTDHVTKRAIQLVAVVLVAALAYRWLGRLGRERARDDGGDGGVPRDAGSAA